MIKRVVVIYGLFLAAIVILADSGRASWLFTAMAGFPMSDKLGHFFLMGSMSFLLTLASSSDPIRVGTWSFSRSTLWLAIVVTLEEISQIWLPSRGFSFLDLGSDFLGILIFAHLAVVYRSRTQGFAS